MASPTPPKPWKAEYAKSGRSSCKTCKNPISKEDFRLGKMVQATQFDGFIPMWNHARCILKKKNQIKCAEDVEGLDALRWEDQQMIRNYAEGGGSGSGNGSAVSQSKIGGNVVYGVEVAQASRATCKHCGQKIMKGEVRISSKPEGQGAKGLAWHHANCFIELNPSIEEGKLSGLQNLSTSDQEAVNALLKKTASTEKSVAELEETEDKQQLKKTGKAGAKRKKDSDDDPKSKVAKVQQDATTTSKATSGKFFDDLESKLEAQSKALWALKDDLKKNVTTAELRSMLEVNNQDSTGSELDLRDRCADGMMFGALGCCPICSGLLRYSGGMYRCHGYLSEWSKCSYSTREPERIRGKWKVPEDTSNEYLCKSFESQKNDKPIRILHPVSSDSPARSQATNGHSRSSESCSLGDLKLSMSGFSKGSVKEWKEKIEGAGGQFHSKIKKDTDFLVVNGTELGEDAEIKKARRMKLPIVREEYLVECFKKLKKLPYDLYKVETVGGVSSTVTIKVKGRSAVHEASGLQDTGHILEDGGSIYNTTLNMSDLSTGVNSYYILQIIQDDKDSDCFVFRKWGRVGNEKIGGSKVENMSKFDAISEFERLFFEKAGNTWESWETKKDFRKKPGRFFPLDIDYGVNKQVTEKKQISTESRLPPPLVELMKMLFNVETYRAAMMEFDINMSEMPLGKLSKANIQNGFQALTEIQNLLNSNDRDSSIKESLLIDASNRFFTVIPSVHPHVIKDEDDFKSKVKMLEALQDIEIASRLVGFDADTDESLDEKYWKLRCCIAPLPHDSEEYQLIEKYLRNTHAPTHTEWSLELEEVFTLEREGEFDKFAPHREKLKNRMLLWHGSRLTNFIGILSQGLRIAPPEAPATGYMFGKGLYFADLVSKSAQYCYTEKKNPVGLMLLSEVALGEVYELKKAKYLERPPEGKHSTKGLGKKVPLESEYEKWRNDVVVPCGKPVASKIKASELMYNEYIVYDTAQVKMQFLLKVRFHHKR